MENNTVLLTIITAAASFVMAIVGFVTKRTLGEIEEVKKNQTELQISMAKEYVSRNELSIVEKRLTDSFNKMELNFNLQFNKLDLKLDKMSDQLEAHVVKAASERRNNEKDTY